MLLSNNFRERLHSGERLVGMYCDTLIPEIVELMAKAGVDFVILDTEHNAFGIEACKLPILAAECSGIVPLVRVYDNNPRLINKALEIGAQGVVIPHVDSAALAQQAVAGCKYPPDGIRGVHPSTRASRFAASAEEWDHAWREANLRTTVVVQPLESLQGLEELPRILEVPGIDLVGLGVGDLSQVLGAPLRSGDPKVREARTRAWRLCAQRRIPAYALVSSASEMQDWYALGVRVFVWGSDLMVFQRALGDLEGVKRGMG